MFPSYGSSVFSELYTDAPKSGMKVVWAWLNCSFKFAFYRFKNALFCISSTGLFTNEISLMWLSVVVMIGRPTADEPEIRTCY